jgi:signal peptidase II
MHKKIFALILLDQITKLIFSGRDFFLGPLHIHLVKNFGLGFSLNFGLLSNLIVIATALAFFIYYYFHHQSAMSWWGEVIFILILSGALSNIIDRLYLGYVRDFLDLGLGFTFNLADAMIVVGLGALLIHQTKPSPKDQF